MSDDTVTVYRPAGFDDFVNAATAELIVVWVVSTCIAHALEHPDDDFDALSLHPALMRHAARVTALLVASTEYPLTPRWLERPPMRHGLVMLTFSRHEEPPAAPVHLVHHHPDCSNGVYVETLPFGLVRRYLTDERATHPLHHDHTRTAP